MKTFTTFAIIAMALFSIAATPVHETVTPAKNANESFDGFSFIRTHRQGKGAVVSWAFNSSDASGFRVQRTNEDPNDPYSVWIDVGSLGCNSSRSYKCHDENPYPGFIKYRVIALMNDGTTMISNVSVVRIMAH